MGWRARYCKDVDAQEVTAAEAENVTGGLTSRIGGISTGGTLKLSDPTWTDPKEVDGSLKKIDD